MLDCPEWKVTQYTVLTFASMHASVVITADTLPSYAVNQVHSLTSMQV
jgi:hypothetical protein